MSENNTVLSVLEEIDRIRAADVQYWKLGHEQNREARAEYHRRQDRLEEIRVGRLAELVVQVLASCRIGKLSMRPSVNYEIVAPCETVKYTVDGLLPEEGRAWLCLNGSSWTILRESYGVYTDGAEQYESPEAALASMDLSN
jgi:hypothetical protein